LIDGQAVQVKDFVYQVRTYQGRKPVYKSVGNRGTEAEAKRAVMESQVSIKAEARTVSLIVVDGPQRKTLSGTSAAYIKQKKDAVWRTKHPDQSLILATRNGKPNSKLLLALKGVARRMKLNCGRCEKCIDRKECEEFTLQPFSPNLPDQLAAQRTGSSNNAGFCRP
jgi:hypothetical protein